MISPPLYSRKSSTVTRPAVPPYSLTTMATCWKRAWSSRSSSLSALVSGMKRGGLSSSGRLGGSGAGGRVEQRAQVERLGRGVHGPQHVADVQDADDVVDRLLEDGDARVAGLDE